MKTYLFYLDNVLISTIEASGILDALDKTGQDPWNTDYVVVERSIAIHLGLNVGETL